MDWQAILQTLGVSSVGMVAVAWLGRSLIAFWLDKETEKFKDTLQAAATAHQHTLDTQAAAHKHQLEQAAMVHRVRFEALHAKRGAIIVELYQESITAMSMLFEFVHALQSSDDDQRECGKRAVSLAAELKKKVLLNRIYFAPDLAEQLVEFANNLFICARRCQMEFNLAKANGRNPYFEQSGEQSYFGKAQDLVDREFQPIAARLESEMRLVLGVGTSDESLARVKSTN